MAGVDRSLFALERAGRSGATRYLATRELATYASMAACPRPTRSTTARPSKGPTSPDGTPSSTPWSAACATGSTSCSSPSTVRQDVAAAAGRVPAGEDQARPRHRQGQRAAGPGPLDAGSNADQRDLSAPGSPLAQGPPGRTGVLALPATPPDRDAQMKRPVFGFEPNVAAPDDDAILADLYTVLDEEAEAARRSSCSTSSRPSRTTAPTCPGCSRASPTSIPGSAWSWPAPSSTSWSGSSARRTPRCTAWLRSSPSGRSLRRS